jgi:hypothetical protein
MVRIFILLLFHLFLTIWPIIMQIKVLFQLSQLSLLIIFYRLFFKILFLLRINNFFIELLTENSLIKKTLLLMIIWIGIFNAF